VFADMSLTATDFPKRLGVTRGRRRAIKQVLAE
jgi:hypothetical protein